MPSRRDAQGSEHGEPDGDNKGGDDDVDGGPDDTRCHHDHLLPPTQAASSQRLRDQHTHRERAERRTVDRDESASEHPEPETPVLQVDEATLLGGQGRHPV